MDCAQAVCAYLWCSMLARFMAMNMDEKVAQVIGRVIVNRLLDWPQQESPDAVKDQLFNVHHAHLIMVSAVQAPTLTM